MVKKVNDDNLNNINKLNNSNLNNKLEQTKSTFQHIINLEGWVDMVAGPLEKITLKDLQFYLYHNKPDSILLYAYREDDKYLGKIFIKKKFVKTTNYKSNNNLNYNKLLDYNENDTQKE